MTTTAAPTAPRLAGAVAVLAAVGVAGYAGICAAVAVGLSRAERVPFTRTPEQFGLDYEDVQFRSRQDDVLLDGWLLKPKVTTWKRPIVVVHGMGADRQAGPGTGILAIATPLVAAGFPVLLFDLRGHGKSGGQRFTLGAHEVRDVGGGVDYLRQRGLADDGVLVLGFSMGAATAILSAADEPLVKALAMDCGFADLPELLAVHVPRMSRLPGFFTPGAIVMARVLFDVDLRGIRPVDAAPVLAQRGVPLLLIHGGQDAIVPPSHSERIAAAYGPGAELYLDPDAAHVGIHMRNPDSYMQRLISFFDKAP